MMMVMRWHITNETSRQLNVMCGTVAPKPIPKRTTTTSCPLRIYSVAASFPLPPPLVCLRSTFTCQHLTITRRHQSLCPPLRYLKCLSISYLLRHHCTSTTSSHQFLSPSGSAFCKQSFKSSSTSLSDALDGELAGTSCGSEVSKRPLPCSICRSSRHGKQ